MSNKIIESMFDVVLIIKKDNIKRQMIEIEEVERSIRYHALLKRKLAKAEKELRVIEKYIKESRGRA